MIELLKTAKPIIFDTENVRATWCRIYIINKNNKDNYIELSGEYKILSYTIDVKDEIQEIRKEKQK